MPYLSRTLKATALGAALAILALPFQTAAAASEATPTLETVFVLAKRQPYRGDFDALETPHGGGKLPYKSRAWPFPAKPPAL